MHPELIGPYRIDRKIGAGGMGNVYCGFHTDTGQVAAVKVLPASMAREEGFVHRFTREIEALRKLSNRHIVEFYENGEWEDTYYYAMEYIDGVTLTHEINRRKRLPWEEVIDLSLQIAAALKAAHDAGIVHRDLKPSNLMITSAGVVKLTDFGVAHVFATTRLTRTGGVVGTAEYMSPEQAQGKRATRQSDLYSLGAVMYAMLTGRPPFTGQSANEILQKHQFANFDKPTRFVAEIPRMLEDFVCQLLEKDPAKRMPDALVVNRRLEQIRSRIAFAAKQSESETAERPAPVATAEVPEGDSSGVRHPGPATLVRDLLREEAAASLHKSPIARFFDNTFVLLLLLGLIIAGGFYFNRRNQTDPRQQFGRARAVLEGKPGPAWLRARDDLLLPLVDDSRMKEHLTEIQRLLDQVDQYEFCRSLQSAASSSGSVQSEIQRLIRRTFDEHSAGDPVLAVRQLDAVLQLLQGNSEYGYLRKFLEDSRQSWRTEQEVAGRRELLLSAMTAARNARDAAEITAAGQALGAVLLLYAQDSSVESELVQCRELLKTMSSETAKLTPENSASAPLDAESAPNEDEPAAGR